MNNAPSTNTAVQRRERRRGNTWKWPDRQRAVAHRREVETFTVKVGLKALVGDEALGQCIEQTVHDVTQLQWEASKILQLYILHRIEHNLPIHVLDAHFFYQALVCATGPLNSSRPLQPDLWQARDELYTPQRQNGLPWISGSLRTQLLKLAAGTLRSNACNHVKENFLYAPAQVVHSHGRTTAARTEPQVENQLGVQSLCSHIPRRGPD